MKNANAITRVVTSVRRGLDALRTGSRRDDDPREVRLLAGAATLPAALEYRLIVEALADREQLPIGALIDRVAVAVYRETLQEDGSAADLGVFGPRIFAPDIRHILEAGNGRLWTISSPATN
jgi:hypothetical protein